MSTEGLLFNMALALLAKEAADADAFGGKNPYNSLSGGASRMMDAMTPAWGAPPGGFRAPGKATTSVSDPKSAPTEAPPAPAPKPQPSTDMLDGLPETQKTEAPPPGGAPASQAGYDIMDGMKMPYGGAPGDTASLVSKLLQSSQRAGAR